MKNILLIIIAFYFIASCNSSKKIATYNDVVKINNKYKYSKKINIIEQYFFLPEKYQYNNLSLYGNILNQHYIQLKNEELDEVQIGIMKIIKEYNNGISDQDAFMENFNIQFSWLKQENFTFENGITDEQNYIIYNVRNSKIEHTILFGAKFNKNIYIQLDNPKTEYLFEVEKIKNIFNTISL